LPLKERINNQIRATELRVILEEGENLGVLSLADALAKARELGVDLIEVSPNAQPPVAKIMDFGKYQYMEAKKAKKMKAGAKSSETKAIQIKVGTGDHDLELKAKTASKWLAEGHRIKVELYLSGRAKYMADAFLKERLDRVLKLITEHYKIAEAPKRGPKGLLLTIERDTLKKS
jgi:translation initiation factor IF-3